MSVTGPTLPRLLLISTVAPPTPTGLPLMSRAVTVTVDVDTPSATIDVGLAAIVELAADAGPAVNATVAVFAPAVPLNVNPTVAVAAVVDDVSVAV